MRIWLHLRHEHRQLEASLHNKYNKPTTHTHTHTMMLGAAGASSCVCKTALCASCSILVILPEQAERRRFRHAGSTDATRAHYTIFSLSCTMVACVSQM